jgi:hypothetical protein
MTKTPRPKTRETKRVRAVNKRERNRVTIALRDKILEGLERTIHLIELVPSDHLDWFPRASASSQKALDFGHLLGHLLDSAAGFCAVLYAAFPSRHGIAGLRELTVNHSCPPAEAVSRLKQYSDCVLGAFDFCRDEDLPRRIPTVFTKSGEPLITLLLGNFEHLTNHKHQLFFYLKQFGVSVNSSDLYRFRADSKRKPQT